ncbi:hypothetical protein CLAM6_21810 [Cobetia sp. AM6]|nr:hypothetical protein CLAM6_21810 [Cobetia sp. AM6]
MDSQRYIACIKFPITDITIKEIAAGYTNPSNTLVEFINTDCHTTAFAFILNIFLLLIHCDNKLTTEAIKTAKDNKPKLILSNPKSKFSDNFSPNIMAIQRIKEEIKKDKSSTAELIFLALRSYLGSTIANGKLSEAIGFNIVCIATNTPNIPNTSGEYNLVTIGDIKMPIACAPAVPETSIKTLIKNLLFFI